MIESLVQFQKAIREEDLSGWLFYNFRHRDAVADYLLGLPEASVNTRPWAFYIPAGGEPLKLVSAVERNILNTLPGRELVYSSRDEFAAALKSALSGRVGLQFSRELPVLSTLDYGTAQIVLEAGAVPVSSAPLVQRMAGVLDGDGIASHNRAAAALYETVRELWGKVAAASKSDKSLYENDILDLLEGMLVRRGLVRDHSPLIAAGVNSGDPHYSLTGRGARVAPGDVIQIDVWAKENTPAAVYADISWVGVYADRPGIEEQELFGLLIRGRDEAVDCISRRLAAGNVPTGAEVDGHVRSFFLSLGAGNLLKHRTGHGIDRQVHGWGVNLDSIEFPDSRKLIEGACFSIEPGLYGKRFGLRTEINMYVEGGRPVISGGEPQNRFLTL